MMNIETSMVRDFFILNNSCWGDLGLIILKVQDRKRLGLIMYKYLSVHEWTYDKFKKQHYPDGCTVGYYKAIKRSPKVFGNIDWNQLIDHMRFIKRLEQSII